MQFDCGISKARLVAWLDDELSLERVGDGWTFAFEDSKCNVSLNPLDDRSLGAYSIERTMLSFEGDDAAVGEFERLFTLRFASAGG